MNNARTLRFRSIAAGLFAIALTTGAVSTLSAAEPEKVGYAKAKYNTTELKRTISDEATLVTTAAPERVTFTVSVDKDGTVSDVTYKHNVTSKPAARVQAFIERAYAAIRSTEFTPATSNGQPVHDTVSIAFELEN